MTFFLEKLGIKLVEHKSDPVTQEIHVTAPVLEEFQPTISALGFEVSNIKLKYSSVIDYSSEAVRAGVFNSFDKFGLIVQDTRSVLPIAFHIGEAELIVSVPSINSICSKLHVEDISPLTNDACNHRGSKCDESHYASGSLLVDIGDYISCDRGDAAFRVYDSCIHIVRGKKWIKLNVRVGLVDGYYTLIKENF